MAAGAVSRYNTVVLRRLVRHINIISKSVTMFGNVISNVTAFALLIINI